MTPVFMQDGRQPTGDARPYSGRRVFTNDARPYLGRRSLDETDGTIGRQGPGVRTGRLGTLVLGRFFCGASLEKRLDETT